MGRAYYFCYSHSRKDLFDRQFGHSHGCTRTRACDTAELPGPNLLPCPGRQATLSPRSHRRRSREASQRTTGSMSPTPSAPHRLRERFDRRPSSFRRSCMLIPHEQLDVLERRRPGGAFVVPRCHELPGLRVGSLQSGQGTVDRDLVDARAVFAYATLMEIFRPDNGILPARGKGTRSEGLTAGRRDRLRRTSAGMGMGTDASSSVILSGRENE